jgi:signal transduction histidine kinase
MIVKNHVNIITSFDPARRISTIRSYLQSIFYNLISNSIKYKRPDTNPEIRITSSLTDNGVRLVFSDNGMGIDLGTQGTKVFGLYKRFHPNTAEGKGMGLFMVKTQVETLGGEISIKSEVNKGTEFTIEL